jgi:hypothetical protein
MAFSIKTWIDRLSEFPNRRRLDSTGIADTYDVTRAEGNVTAEGDKFDAATMNDLEGRIAEAFTSMAEKSDIPTALKNPYALTLAGAVSGTYDGSAAKTFTIPTTSTNTTSIAGAITVSTAAPSSYIGDGKMWGVY